MSGALPHEAYLVALATLEGVGPGRLRWLLSLAAPEDVWSAVRRRELPSPPAPLAIQPALLARWAVDAAKLEPAALWRTCSSLDVGVVSLGSPGYPPALLEDPDPPVVLFHRGDPDVLDAPRVAIIGTRRATGYGVRTAEMLGRDLADAGVSVVSGLALGIDAAAHRGATRSTTAAAPVAVVGSGHDAPCPARNRSLADQVAERGVILSEVPPGVPAAPWRFPVRNRILAALGQVVVVVESAAAGGSMHTVREAVTRSRPVLAVPGPIDSRASDGANLLLSEGAHPCLAADDVLVALGQAPPTARQRAARQRGPVDSRPTPAGDAAAVLEGLGWRPATADQLALRSGLDFPSLAAALRELESAGWIARTDGWIERVARGASITGGSRSGA